MGDVEAFEPEKFHDEYREKVMEMIEARIEGHEPVAAETKRAVPTNVVDLMDVLQRSLEVSRQGKSGAKAAASAKPAARKKTAANAAKPKRKKSAA